MEESASENLNEAIYRHSKRPEWGNAILAWDREDKRGYQFEDGKLRIFKQGWYDQLQEIDQAADRAHATVARLQRKVGIDALDSSKRVTSSGAVAFDDQLQLLEQLYPGGFTGERWTAKLRGTGATRRLKRHRDAAIAEAVDKLPAAALDELIEAGQYREVWDRIIAVLSGTSLLSVRQLAPFEEPRDCARLVNAARNLLWGEASYAVRFERFVGALAATGKEPSWNLATALSALVHPRDHICVRPGSFRKQAAWMAPRLRYSKYPDAALYERFLGMALRVRDELIERGYAPRDLMDVYDFMWETLRPSALDKIEAMKRAPAREGAEVAEAA